MILSKIQKELTQLANPPKAKILAGFFKTGKSQYGEGDKFLGIVVPLQRQLAKKYYHDVHLKELSMLLHGQWHEERLLALLMMIEKYRRADQKEQEKIYKLYLKNTKFINNWDLVDLTAQHIVGAWLEDKDRAILYKLAKSKNLWEKRIAMLSTFYYIYRKDFTDTLKIAKILLKDDHDLIHKAVGWMLREIGKRDLATEEKFLQKHYKQMPRTMLRYAIEKFPEQKRQKYLK